MSETTYAVHAIQYARSLRPSSDLYLADDPHNGPFPLIYYIWVIRNAERTIVVDTGFNAERARQRKREFLRCPTDGLRSLGIDAAEVDKDPIRGDVLYNAFQHLPFLELADDLLFLFFNIGFDKCLMRHHHVLELLVDLHHLKFHGLAYILVVIPNGLHVDLRTGKEGLDAEYIDNHTTFRPAFHVAGDHLFLVMGLIYPFPGFDRPGLPVRKNQLPALILADIDKDLHLIAYLQVWIIPKFVQRNNAFRFCIDIDNGLAVCNMCYSPFHNLFVGRVHKVFCHEFLKLLQFGFVYPLYAFFILLPVEVLQKLPGIFNGRLLLRFLLYFVSLLRDCCCFLFSHFADSICIPQCYGSLTIIAEVVI